VSFGIVDSTVIIHLYRKNSNAHVWLAQQTQKLSVTTITWLEIMRGAPNKQAQQTCKALLDQFELLYLSNIDQDWAMNQIRQYRFSRGVDVNDCLIASLSHRLQIPIFTHNVKDMLKILPNSLVIQPYP
jgi:predicted nucleic acid-binding protein